MAETTEAQDTETTEAIDLEAEATTEEESTEASDGDDTTEEAQTSEQDQEFEVVLESKGSQPEPAKTSPISIGKRINKLNAKVDTAQQGEEKANNELILANERNRLLQIQLDQGQQARAQPVMPIVDDFPEGVNDPDYVKKYQEYMARTVQTEITRQVQEATKQTVQTSRQAVQSQELERNQLRHIKKSNELGLKDYIEMEEKALLILGPNTMNQIINDFENSHLLVYHLGKNEDKAQDIANKIQINPFKGVAELGAIDAKLMVKPKTKITPNPDTPLAGGSPSKANDTDAQAQKLLERAEKTGSQADLNKYFDHQDKRRQQKAASG